MTAPEPTPTAEHTDAVARAASVPDWGAWDDAACFDHNKWTFDGTHRTEFERKAYRDAADAILTSTDPAVHAAMLDALVRAGVLEQAPGTKVRWEHSKTRPGRIDEVRRRTYLGPWQVAP